MIKKNKFLPTNKNQKGIAITIQAIFNRCDFIISPKIAESISRKNETINPMMSCRLEN